MSQPTYLARRFSAMSHAGGSCRRSMPPSIAGCRQASPHPPAPETNSMAHFPRTPFCWLGVALLVAHVSGGCGRLSSAGRQRACQLLPLALNSALWHAPWLAGLQVSCTVQAGTVAGELGGPASIQTRPPRICAPLPSPTAGAGRRSGLLIGSGRGASGAKGHLGSCSSRGGS